MTIQNTTLRKAGPSQGNGVTTVFPFTFKVFTATDILVTYLDALAVESVLVLSTNYTISLNADQNASPGGSVTLLVAPATATYITLTSQVTNTQTLALTNSGGFYPESINNALDRTVIEIQQLAEKVSRTVSIPTSSTASVTLPIPAGGNVIGWNATATALTNLPAATGTSLVSLAASTGSTLVGHIAGGAGAVARKVASKLNDTVSVFDFMTAAQIADVQSNTASIDCYGAFQAATNAVQTNSLGGVIYIPVGTYLISGGTITNDRSANSALGRVSFKGQDENGTRIKYTGSGNNCFYLANNQTAALEQSASYQIISDMTILGNVGLRSNSTGVVMNLGAFAKFERLNIQGFDFGMYLLDVDQAYFEKINLRFNNKGLFGTKSPTPGVSSTQPNNWTYVSCTISNNNLYGATIIGGSAHTWVGGDVEYNGLSNGVNGWGLAFTDSGYEGGKGCNLHGVYFEGNQGIADLMITATTVNVTPMLGVVHHVSSEFHRNGVGLNSYNIVCSFGADATVGKQILVLTASSFKSFATYTPSSLTPNIGYSITPADITNFFDLGSYYSSTLEKPVFVQNLNKMDLVVAKATNQTFTTAVSTVWALDSVLNANPLWSPTVSSGSIIIIATGTYNISIFTVLSTSAIGTKSFLIKKNTTIIGYGEGGSATNVAGASCTARCAVGDVITIIYTQITGVNQDIVGAGSSSTSVTITKLF